MPSRLPNTSSVSEVIVTGSVASLVFLMSTWKVTLPPGSLMLVGLAVLVTSMEGGFSSRESVKVQVVILPDCTVMPVTLLPLLVPVAVPLSRAQAAVSSFQPVGIVSTTE